eukprot:TRINITY_DN55530_c0_g1_i1.p1 TRINITY_DN55530_c0_g1~~TRINITY_DN55530_c0_g1_i1.p1  ORF type:complete len:613 (-),score=42.23 TRINITY_DN55530_c0_g1_i1:145-1983(-)
MTPTNFEQAACQDSSMHFRTAEDLDDRSWLKHAKLSLHEYGIVGGPSIQGDTYPNALSPDRDQMLTRAMSLRMKRSDGPAKSWRERPTPLVKDCLLDRCPVGNQLGGLRNLSSVVDLSTIHPAQFDEAWFDGFADAWDYLPHGERVIFESGSGKKIRNSHRLISCRLSTHTSETGELHVNGLAYTFELDVTRKEHADIASTDKTTPESLSAGRLWWQTTLCEFISASFMLARSDDLWLESWKMHQEYDVGEAYFQLAFPYRAAITSCTADLEHLPWDAGGGTTDVAVFHKTVHRPPDTHCRGPIAGFEVPKHTSSGLRSAFAQFFLLDILQFRHNYTLIADVAAVVFRHTNAELVMQLQKFASSWPCPAVFIDGLPLLIDTLQTPRSRGFLAHENMMMAVDAIMAGLYHILGLKAYAVSHENHGMLVRNVVARLGAESQKSSHGSLSTFPWHTDNPSDISPPPYLGFVCIRNLERVPTEIAWGLDVAQELRKNYPDVHGLLQNSSFTLCPPDSNHQKLACLERVPILWYDANGTPHFRFDANVAKGTTSQQSSALVMLSHVMDIVPSYAVNLGPGQVFVFDNSQVFHRRVGFQPKVVNSRWLRRQYALLRVD